MPGGTRAASVREVKFSRLVLIAVPANIKDCFSPLGILMSLRSGNVSTALNWCNRNWQTVLRRGGKQKGGTQKGIESQRCGLEMFRCTSLWALLCLSGQFLSPRWAGRLPEMSDSAGMENVCDNVDCMVSARTHTHTCVCCVPGSCLRLLSLHLLLAVAGATFL